jgi:hypothetical protein
LLQAALVTPTAQNARIDLINERMDGCSLGPTGVALFSPSNPHDQLTAPLRQTAAEQEDTQDDEEHHLRAAQLYLIAEVPHQPTSARQGDSEAALSQPLAERSCPLPSIPEPNQSPAVRAGHVPRWHRRLDTEPSAADGTTAGKAFRGSRGNTHLQSSDDSFQGHRSALFQRAIKAVGSWRGRPGSSLETPARRPLAAFVPAILCPNHNAH